MQHSRRWHSAELSCLNPFPSGADTGHRVRPTLPGLRPCRRQAISLATAKSTFSCRDRNRVCSPQPKKTASKKAKTPTPIKTAQTAAKKKTAKKQAAG